MGNYLNTTTVRDAYLREYNSPYFVDKSAMLEELIQSVDRSANCVCITRPRRFGKTVAANMIASFFSKECSMRDVFGRMKIASCASYQDYMGKYDVVFISFNEMPRRCGNYEQYIGRIEDRLIRDLSEAYPKARICGEDAVWDAFLSVYQAYDSKKFIFVLDEWDFIFHRHFVTEEDKASYIDFLSNLLKGKAYVSLAYMTGILPISKYSSGSELNMFIEYTMGTEERFAQYFGFTEAEVDCLYEKFRNSTENAKVTREGLRSWYDGYLIKSGERLYNPRSVVAALTNNNLGNYWTSSGPYDELFYYIRANVDAVRDSLALMVSGIPVPAKVQEYAAVSMNLTTKDEILSAMVVYGFLNYANGCVSIPNKELMDKFNDMLLKEPSLGYVNRLARASAQMLTATLQADTDKMAEILEYAHNTESPLLSYNHETELTAVVSLVYLAARDTYRIEREDKAGKGYVDFIFYPETDHSLDGIILELKAGSTAEDALQQIRDKKYAMKFDGRLGEEPKYTGRVLGVGIAYDKAEKSHSCRVETLRNAL